MNAFLQDMLGAANPRQGEREVKVVDILGKALEGVPTAYAGQPELEAAVRDTVGVTYQNLGELGLAEPQIRAALELRRKALGPDHADTLASAQHLVSQLYMEGRYREGGAGAAGAGGPAPREGPRRPRRPSSACTTRHAAAVRERPSRREPRAHEGDGRRAHCACWVPSTGARLLSASTLASLYMNVDRLDEAEALLRQVLAAQERTLGPDHSNTIYTVKALGGLLHDRKRLDEKRTRCCAARWCPAGGCRARATWETLVAANDLADAADGQGRAAGSGVAAARGGDRRRADPHARALVHRRLPPQPGEVPYQGEEVRGSGARAAGRARGAGGGARGPDDRETRAAVRRLGELYEAWRPARRGRVVAEPPAPSPSPSPAASPAKPG